MSGKFEFVSGKCQGILVSPKCMNPECRPWTLHSAPSDVGLHCLPRSVCPILRIRYMNDHVMNLRTESENVCKSKFRFIKGTNVIHLR